MGSKFTIPCNAFEHIKSLFGSNNEWIMQKKNDYVQNSMNWTGTRWTDEEIPYAIRRFDPSNGQLDVKLTLNLTNKFFDDVRLHIKEIPIDNKYEND